MIFRDKKYTALVFLVFTFVAHSHLYADTHEQKVFQVKSFFKSYCIECHGPNKSKGKITLHSLDVDLSNGHEMEKWELILDVLRSGEMPPEEEKQPRENERSSVANWIDDGLRQYVEKAKNQASAATVRRLTNFEYQNTMNDLLGIELDLIKNLPQDPVKPYAFNNSAEYLLLGSEQLDRYEENARRAMASVIVDPKPPETHKARQNWGTQVRPIRKNKKGEVIKNDNDGLQQNELGIKGNYNRTVANGMQVKSWPERGEFLLRVNASAALPEGYYEVPVQVLMGYDIVGIGVGTGTNLVERVGILKLTNTSEPQTFELRGRIENIPTVPEVQFRRGGKIDGKLITKPAHITITPMNIFDDGTLNERQSAMTKPRARINWIEFEAPVADSWPPAHHKRILFESSLRRVKPGAYVEKVLRRFMTRAFRRPVTDDEVKRYVKVYEIVSKQLNLKTIEDAMRETLTMLLLSPEFMYHRETNEAAHYHYEIASKLSYFLWGTMPDQQLFDLAAKKQLDDPKVIKQQVERLLKDSRAKDFVANFTSQWLSIEKMKTVPINLSLFPRFLYTIKGGERRGAEVPYRPTIRDYMHEETIAFIAELVKRNAPILNIVDSDFAMLNQPLAVHYGVNGVEGHELRPVSISSHHHLGGLLTHGSVLIANSTGSAPHPIYRAVWLREAILGDEVKEPPAEVPALSDSVGTSAEKAVRIKDLLALHRQKESCNDCHVRLDPWGVPFEHYNSIGQYEPFTTKEGVTVSPFDRKKHKNMADYLSYLKKIKTVKVDARARVPHGPEVNGIADLKRHLIKDRKNDIVKNVISRLFSYAMGRGLTYQDRYIVEDLLTQTKSNGHRWQDIIVAICQSDAFLRRNSQ